VRYGSASTPSCTCAGLRRCSVRYGSASHIFVHLRRPSSVLGALRLGKPHLRAPAPAFVGARCATARQAPPSITIPRGGCPPWPRSGDDGPRGGPLRPDGFRVDIRCSSLCAGTGAPGGRLPPAPRTGGDDHAWVEYDVDRSRLARQFSRP
jgi:hypothetical protein